MEAEDERDLDVWPGRCDRCDARLSYSQTYDATFCAADDRWVELGCSDGTCSYCAARPTKPSRSRLDLDLYDFEAE